MNEPTSQFGSSAADFPSRLPGYARFAELARTFDDLRESARAIDRASLRRALICARLHPYEQRGDECNPVLDSDTAETAGVR